ncbi:MAG: DUF4221 family protein [Microscillaceae bacterium]|nr:DUF4221 family protein [Microscillaceae bacterium]
MTDPLIIPIDSNTSFRSSYLDYYENSDKSYLVYLSNTNSHILFFDLATKQKTYEITYPEEGPGRITQIDAFKIINQDSVIVVSLNWNRGWLTDWEGNILNDFALKPDETNPYLWVDNFKRIDFIPPHYFIYNKAPYLKANQPGFWDNPITFIYNFDDQSTKDVFTHKGKSASKICAGAYIRYGFTVANDELIYSFGLDDNIYVKSLSSGNVKNFYAGSDYCKEIPNMKVGIEDLEKRIFFNQNYAYRHIIYDPFREVYYRFVLHPIPEEDNADLLHGKPFSIIILLTLRS